MSQNATAKYVAAIRSLWSFGTKESIGYFPCNPASELAMEWEETLSQRILSEEQIWTLEEAASEISDRHLLLFQLIYYSGCRVGRLGKRKQRRGKNRVQTGAEVEANKRGWRLRHCNGDGERK